MRTSCAAINELPHAVTPAAMHVCCQERAGTNVHCHAVGRRRTLTNVLATTGTTKQPGQAQVEGSGRGWDSRVANIKAATVGVELWPRRY